MIKHLMLARYKAKLDTAYLDYGLRLQIYPYLHYKHQADDDNVLGALECQFKVHC